jgi:hypothetical protein
MGLNFWMPTIVCMIAMAFVFAGSLIAMRDKAVRGPMLLQAAGIGLLLLISSLSILVTMCVFPGAEGSSLQASLRTILSSSGMLAWILFAMGYFMERISSNSGSRRGGREGCGT